MDQVLCIKDEDCTILLTKISKFKEEILVLKEGMEKLGRRLGLDLFLLNREPGEHAPITIPSDEEDYKSKLTT